MLHPLVSLQREVYNPKAEARLQFSAAGAGPRVAQAGITLHRKHELPSGVYTTGGHGAGGSSMVGGTPQEGYTFYLRPDDGSQISINALDVRWGGRLAVLGGVDGGGGGVGWGMPLVVPVYVYQAQS